MPLPLDSTGPKDFDFIIGTWQVKHKRLKSRFAQCEEWLHFDGESTTSKILGGFGNVEDNLLHYPEGSFRAAAIRSYCETSATWSIWWLDGRNPTQLDVPVVGTFSNHTGQFFADDFLDGSPIKVRFTWIAVPGEHPRWEQAFSNDAGSTWETNWKMEFVPEQSEA